jgi:hypothetical protein
MSDRYNFTGKQKMRFAIMAVIGLVLIGLGYLVSRVGGEEAHHGADQNSHGTEAPAGHSDASAPLMLASGDGRLYAQAHGEEQPAAEHGSETHSTESAPAEHGTEAHATEAHAEGGHDAHAAHGDHAFNGDTRAENGAWTRAPLHEGQAIEVAHHGAPSETAKFGGILLMAGFWFMGVALAGIFFQAFSFVANAGWHVAFKRVPETFYMFIPVAGIVLLLAWVLKDHVWSHWAPSEIRTEGSEHYDSIIAHKWPILDPMFLLGTMLIFPAVWWLFGHKLRQNSLKEDTQGGIALFKNSFRVSAGFLPIFGVSFCVAGFQWMMSLEPHWFSTIFSVYCFATTFVSGITIMTLIVVHLKERGYLPEVNANHLHDLGKFMFAFSIFWSYIWISQYLLIWYANIPEETIYYVNRLKDYKGLFFLNILMNFAFPFLSLMPKNAKRQVATLKIIGWGILLGRFIDMFLLVMPGVLGPHWNFGVVLMGLGMFVVMGALFLFVVFHFLSKAPLVAKNHPYLEESVHHSTGV